LARPLRTGAEAENCCNYWFCCCCYWCWSNI